MGFLRSNATANSRHVYALAEVSRATTNSPMPRRLQEVFACRAASKQSTRAITSSDDRCHERREINLLHRRQHCERLAHTSKSLNGRYEMTDQGGYWFEFCKSFLGWVWNIAHTIHAHTKHTHDSFVHDALVNMSAKRGTGSRNDKTWRLSLPWSISRLSYC